MGNDKFQLAFKRFEKLISAEKPMNAGQMVAIANAPNVGIEERLAAILFLFALVEMPKKGGAFEVASLLIAGSEIKDERLLAAWLQFLELNDDQIATIAKASDVERRLAAILWQVAGAKSEIRVAAAELMILLSPGWKELISERAKDPTKTDLGRAIVKAMRELPQGTLSPDEQRAVELVRLADDPDANPDETQDMYLRGRTGADGMWWIGLIRANRKK